jgi:hypothetical protein
VVTSSILLNEHTFNIHSMRRDVKRDVGQIAAVAL